MTSSAGTPQTDGRPAARAWVPMAGLALLAALTAVGVRAQEGAGPPAVGQAAPDFSLTAIDDSTVTLSDELKASPVVLVVLRGWVGYHCPFCVAQFGEYLGRKDDLLAAGARVVWVYPAATSEEVDAEGFVGSEDVPSNFRLLIDPGFGFTMKYGLRWNAPGETAYPATFIIDQTGTVRFARVSREHGGRVPVDDVLTALADLR